MKARWAPLVVVLVLAGGCGDHEGGVEVAPTTSIRPPTTVTGPSTAVVASSTTTTTTTSVPASTSSTVPPTSTTVPAPPTTLPAGVPVLLVVDVDGVWLWPTTGARRLVLGGSIASALPDRIGGIVYQEVETGAWRPVEDATSSAARWRWVGEGSAQPIRRVGTIGGASEIVVGAPRDGKLTLVDTAIVDGRPTLAYLRTRYFTVTVVEPDVNPWWGSAKAELVVRDLVTGRERVVRTQDVGWEYDSREPSLGEDVVAEAVIPYGGDDAWVRLLGFDGARVDVPYGQPSCDGLTWHPCDSSLVADLPPTGQLLAAACPRHATGEPTRSLDVVAIDRRTGREQLRVTVTVPGDPSLGLLYPLALDAAGGRLLLVTATDVPMPDSTRPELRRGDRGPWVRLLQDRLSGGSTYLALDGRFGPRTEAAVKAAQVAGGLEPTGVVDTATWRLVIGSSMPMLNAPVLVEPDGSSHPVAVAPTPHLWGDAPMTLWTAA